MCDEELPGVTSQMVLLCSWRTVKEVSLLLGFLAEEATITLSSQDSGLLTGDALLKIGDHLTSLLAETKHRGAFEQAYVGFCKLVSRLWRLPGGHLQKLPKQWLEETMQEICSNKETLCATRRSAGIPFMIQALICTQLEVEGMVAIEPWVCRLLDMAENATVIPTTRTHALNILRALFRNTQLGEAVSIFVERAIIITITSFSANSWMERNSATLLLSALMTRVFGVPRSKSQDHLSWKNKMTGRIFFQRYPKLFGFFQQELRKASESKNDNLHPSLYPVLLILGRLYPSSLEGTDSNLQLIQYIPDILVCAGSNIYKTRSLAAKAMVALMSSSQLDTLISKLTQPGLTANFKHGLLLQIAEFLMHSNTKVDQSMFKKFAEKWIETLVKTCSSKSNFMQLESLFQALNVFCEKYFECVSSDIWMQLQNTAKSYLKMSQSSTGFGCLFRVKICEFLLKSSVLLGSRCLGLLCCEFLKDDMYEVRHIVLDFIGCLNSDADCSKIFCDFLKNVQSEHLIHCKYLIFGGVNGKGEVLNIFVEMVLDMLFPSSQKYFYHPEDKTKILSVLKSWRDALKHILVKSSIHPELENIIFLVNMCNDSHPDVAVNSVYCLTEYMCIKDVPWQGEDLNAVCELLVKLNKPESSGVFDHAVYELVSRHLETLQCSVNPINRLGVYIRLIKLSDYVQWQSAVDRVMQCESDLTVQTVLLTALSMGHQQSDQRDTTGRVFDKGEVNYEYEEYILSRICGERLRGLCHTHKHLLSEPLPHELSGWLHRETGLHGHSLADLISLAKLTVLQLDSDNPCQFLSSGYQRLKLNSLKLNNIL